jgi:hypothetical protein
MSEPFNIDRFDSEAYRKDLMGRGAHWARDFTVERLRDYALGEHIGVSVVTCSVRKDDPRFYIECGSDDSIGISNAVRILTARVIFDGHTYRVTDISSWGEIENDYGGEHVAYGLRIQFDRMGSDVPLADLLKPSIERDALENALSTMCSVARQIDANYPPRERLAAHQETVSETATVVLDLLKKES